MSANKTNKKKIISLLLLMAIFFSSYILARYTSSITGTSSPRKIAKWTVSRDYSDNSSNQLDLIYGNDTNTQSYILKIKSVSDVSARYSITLNNLPQGLEVKIDDGKFYSTEKGYLDFNSKDYTINLSDSNKEKTHTLTFRTSIDSNIPNINKIDINLKFTQID